MDGNYRPSLRKARSLADTDNDNQEKESLLSPSSCESRKSYNVW